MKYFKDYEKLDKFEIIQLVKFFWKLRINWIEDLRLLQWTYNISANFSQQKSVVKRFRLFISALNVELKQIKKIHWDKEFLQHLYFYFPK